MLFECGGCGVDLRKLDFFLPSKADADGQLIGEPVDLLPKPLVSDVYPGCLVVVARRSRADQSPGVDLCPK
jgi:hypothetical protein